MTRNPYPWPRPRRVTAAVLTAAGLGAVLSALSVRPVPAVADSKAATRDRVGTYLVQEGSGAQAIWTLERDGAFLGTSSTQPAFRFSDQQGSWEKDGNRGVKAVLLDFSFDAGGSAINVARADVVLRPVGGDYDTVEGEFTLRFFEPGEDPLDPASDTGQPITDTFTGRRVDVPR